MLTNNFGKMFSLIVLLIIQKGHVKFSSLKIKRIIYLLDKNVWKTIYFQSLLLNS